MSSTTSNTSIMPQVPRASLLFSCPTIAAGSVPEESGVLAKFNDFVVERGLQVRNQSVLVDAHQLFVRAEWELDETWTEEAEFEREFLDYIDQAEASISAYFGLREQSLGLFVSEQSHALLEVFKLRESEQAARFNCSFIIANSESLRGIADRFGVPFFFIDTSGDALAYEKRQLEILTRYKPDYIGLAHYDRPLSADFLQRAASKIIDVQHAYNGSVRVDNPYFEAYQRGVKMIGATSRLVSAQVDQGQIIEQGFKRVRPGVDQQAVRQLGKEIESQVFARAIEKALAHKIIVFAQRTIVFD